jgi:hypothetical protein
LFRTDRIAHVDFPKGHYSGNRQRLAKLLIPFGTCAFACKTVNLAGKCVVALEGDLSGDLP